MLHGGLVAIDKDKNGNRLIGQAIESGITLFGKHSTVPTSELIAYFNPRFYLEYCNNDEVKYSVDVHWHKDVPYAMVWVCKKGESK